MGYEPRLVCPENGNKYYNRKVNGGYSKCVRGNKSKSCFNPKLDVLPNCVGYAWGRFNEIGNYGEFKYFTNGNAEDLYVRCQTIGLEVGQEPKLGSMIVWRKGKAETSSDGAGHVAVVEVINEDGSIVTSESGWDANKLFWTQKRQKGSKGNWGQATTYTFLGFVYNPAVNEDILRKGDKGPKVKQLQKDLNTFGWYDLTIDGSFGPGTEKAVKDAQGKLGLTVDGIVDSTMQSKLSEANEMATGSTLRTIIVDGKQRQLPGMLIDGWNFIRLKDLDYKFDLAGVTYNTSKKMPEVKTK